MVDDLTISSMEGASCNVLVLRHSHVYWLGSVVQSVNPAELFTDFEVQGHSCNVHYMGIQGATVTLYRDHAVLVRVASCCADVVVLHIGGNDLDGRSAPESLLVALDIHWLPSKLLAMGDIGCT